MDHIAHLDEIEPRAFEAGDIAAERRRIASAVQTKRVGLSHYRIAPGRRMMPLHVHADEEEVFYVLGGSGWSVQATKACAVRTGDCIVHVCNGKPHTLVAGDEGLEVIVFATGSDTSLTWLPRADAWFAGPRWMPAGGPHPFELEAAAGPFELPEPGAPPANVVSTDAVEASPWCENDVDVVERMLGAAAGSQRSGLNLQRVAPGKLNAPPHCHSVEEEVFMVLEGSGELELWDSDALAERAALRPGHVVARPPRTHVSHAFRAGEAGMTLLVYGTRDDADICFYPRSQKVNLRGIGVIFRPERLGYWDGEPS